MNDLPVTIWVNDGQRKHADFTYPLTCSYRVPPSVEAEDNYPASSVRECTNILGKFQLLLRCIEYVWALLSVQPDALRRADQNLRTPWPPACLKLPACAPLPSSIILDIAGAIPHLLRQSSGPPVSRWSFCAPIRSHA